jgi:hypothetical protein
MNERFITGKNKVSYFGKLIPFKTTNKFTTYKLDTMNKPFQIKNENVSLDRFKIGLYDYRGNVIDLKALKDIRNISRSSDKNMINITTQYRHNLQVGDELINVRKGLTTQAYINKVIEVMDPYNFVCHYRANIVDNSLKVYRKNISGNLTFSFT